MTYSTLHQRKQGWRPADTFANRLRNMRHDLGMSVQELAALTDGALSHASLSNWERGARPHKLDEVVDVLAAVTNVDRDWLLWGESLPGGLGARLKPEVDEGRRRGRTRPRDNRPRSAPPSVKAA